MKDSFGTYDGRNPEPPYAAPRDETPETDHAFAGSHLESGFIHEFCKKLERDRNALRAQLDAANGAIEVWQREAQSAQAQLAGVVEKAAKVCYDKATDWRLMDRVAESIAAGECFTAIRALSPVAGKGEQECECPVEGHTVGCPNDMLTQFDISPPDATPQDAQADAWKIDGYEYLRRLTPNDFKRLWERNLAGKNFDDMIKDAARVGKQEQG